MGLLSGVARALLVIINILFLLVGLAIAAVGFILRFSKAIWQPVLDEGIKVLKKVADSTKLFPLDTDKVDLGELISSLAIALIVGGLVLCALAFLGCCGACYKINVVLWVYVIVIAVFVIGETVAIGILYGKPKIAKDQLKENSLKKYKGLTSLEVMSLGWNVIMITFDCCGVESYEDFNVSAGWNRYPANKSLPGLPPLLTPVACCKTPPFQVTKVAFSCAQAPFDATKNNGKTGCYDKIWGLSFGKTAIAIPVLAICGLIQVGFIIFAIIIIKFGKDTISPI